MAINSAVIGNGIHLCHIASEKFKTVHIALLIRRRLDRREVTKNALIPMVLKRGSARYPTLSAVHIRADELYGAVFDCGIMKKGEEQIIQFYLELLNDTVKENLLRDGLLLLRELALNPVTEAGGFKKEYVDSEKENLRKRIESRADDKKAYAGLRMLEIMCENEPFGIYGDGYAQDLAAIDPVNLYRHYRQMISESPMDFIVIGNCDTEALAERLRTLFVMERTALKPIPAAEIRFDPKRLEPKMEPREIYERADIAQAKLCIGIRCGAAPVGDGFYALTVLNELFGGVPDGRLFTKVRGKEGLCYYIGSTLYRFKAILCVQAGINAADCKKTVAIIRQQLEELQNGRVTSGETEKAKKSLIKKMTGLYDRPQGVMDFYLAERMLGQLGGIGDAIAGIQGVDKQAVIDAAQRAYFDTVYLLSAPEGKG